MWSQNYCEKSTNFTWEKKKELSVDIALQSCNELSI